MIKKTILLIILFSPFLLFAQQQKVISMAYAEADKLEQKVISWRRDFHANPELGNREFRTAEIVAKHLRSLNMEVTTGIAKTGVVGVLKGSQPGPVIALRADMDALPVTERGTLAFASKITTNYNGKETGVMHACGHDAHTAILMGVAEILAGMRKDIKGTIKFIFQPAEEGAPAGEEGGAKLMIKEGVMEKPKVDVIFGLHTDALSTSGQLLYKPGGFMASACDMKIIIKGKGSHGAAPWTSIDPVVTASQVISALQTIVSRNVNLTENPAVVSIGSISGGNRFNIVPEQVEMLGTVRTFSDADRTLIFGRIREIATNIAAANNATAEVQLPLSVEFPVTFNDSSLVKKMLPSLQSAAGISNTVLTHPVTVSEDFSYYQQKVPGLYFFLGGRPATAAPTSHHTADFFLDESSFKVGVKAFLALVFDYEEKK